MTNSILVVEDDDSLLLSFRHFLVEAGYEAVCAHNYDEAMDFLSSREITVIIADIVLGGKSGIDLLRAARSKGYDCPFIIMTGHPEIETASEAVRMDAFDYLIKPVDKNALLTIAKKSTEHYRLKKENEQYRKNLDAIFRTVQDGILAVDPNMSIIEANQSLRRICGFPETCAGINASRIELPCSGRCVTILQQTIATKKPIRLYRIECARKNARGQVVTVTTSPLFDNHETMTGAIAVVHDETRMVELEKEEACPCRLHRLIGASEAMQKLYSLIRTLSGAASTVLIIGESGTGKELAAEAIHYSGPRAEKPMVKVNCPALNKELLASELFGHVKGSFSGAIADHAGKFECADSGTIFLDEIAELSLDTQVKLLRVLQDKTIERVGGNKSIKVDVRIIAATNRDLQEYVRQGRFREDLFYRLNVMNVRMPPLREKKDDIPLLSAHFMHEYSATFGKNIESLSADVLEFFKDYPWPGNVRELSNAIEHACLLCNRSTITLDDLPSGLWQMEEMQIKEPADNRVTPEMIKEMLRSCNGNKTETARRLNISRRTIYRKLFGKDRDAATT